MNDPGDPVEVWVRTELSKIEWRYVTFFPSSLRPLLELYISKLGEDGSSRLFPVKRDTLTKRVRNALKLAGVKTPPYSLRSYFRTRLAEANGIVPRIYSEFWMGRPPCTESAEPLVKLMEMMEKGVLQEEAWKRDGCFRESALVQDHFLSRGRAESPSMQAQPVGDVRPPVLQGLGAGEKRAILPHLALDEDKQRTARRHGGSGVQPCHRPVRGEVRGE